MNRRNLLLLSLAGIGASLFASNFLSSLIKNKSKNNLVPLNIPNPKVLRGGWAAMAAVHASRGWTNDVYATKDQWLYHDGGGNWATLRFKEKDQAIIIGHDHEYSNTYFGKGAEYFGEEETNLLEDVPDWWSFDLDPKPLGEWIGFVYGWNGNTWQRAKYSIDDGFDSVGLLNACSINNTDLLKRFAADAPGLNGKEPNASALSALVNADANITIALLEAVVPGWDIEAGVTAAHKFLQADI